MRDPDSFLRRCSSPDLIHQHQGSGSCKAYKKISRRNRGSRFWHVPSIIAQLAISLANVLKLFSMSSSFESRVSRESCALRIHQRMCLANRAILVPHLKLAYSAGTKHPHIPMIVSSPTCRRYVLFPEHVNDQCRNEKFGHFLAATISHKYEPDILNQKIKTSDNKVRGRKCNSGSDAKAILNLGPRTSWNDEESQQ